MNVIEHERLSNIKLRHK